VAPAADAPAEVGASGVARKSRKAKVVVDFSPVGAVSFGYGGGEEEHNQFLDGLGDQLGATLVRSQLTDTSFGSADSLELNLRRRDANVEAVPPSLRSEALQWQECLQVPPRAPGPADAGDPRGLCVGLTLSDPAPPDEGLLGAIAAHRWTFKGAVELATQSRGWSFLVWCLLEVQSNVQRDREGDALESEKVRACRSFVTTQGRHGRMGDMYQVLTHFICNSLVFHEWDKFLRCAFEHERARDERFLVPHLDQVWGRFLRLTGVLQAIFGALDDRFVWRHRLPKVGDLVLEHMRRRCFSSELVEQSLHQASTKNDTLKQLKFTFGFT